MSTERSGVTSFTNLRFLCVTTGKPIDYEVPGDAQTLKDLWARTLLRSCCHCGKVHRFDFRTAYVDGVLADLDVGASELVSPTEGSTAPFGSDER